MFSAIVGLPVTEGASFSLFDDGNAEDRTCRSVFDAGVAVDCTGAEARLEGCLSSDVVGSLTLLDGMTAAGVGVFGTEDRTCGSVFEEGATDDFSGGEAGSEGFLGSDAVGVFGIAAGVDVAGTCGELTLLGDGFGSADEGG